MLKTYGVENFVLKPVRRSYAFELGGIPRGEQWVLKARYAASKPTLPLGLSGTPPPLPPQCTQALRRSTCVLIRASGHSP